MQWELNFSRSKLRGYTFFNRTFLNTVALLLAIGWSIKTVVDYSKAEKNYEILLKKEEKVKKSLSRSRLDELKRAHEEDVLIEKFLSQWFKNYQIILPRERLFESQEQFEDQWQRDIIAIQEKAKKRFVTLPVPFYLGNTQPQGATHSPEELLQHSKEEFHLFWIADHLCEYPNYQIEEFTYKKDFKRLEFINAETLGSLIIVIRTNESTFQKILNGILASPYYLIIENITIENNNKIGPQHLLEEKNDSIKKILGGDKLKISMKITLLYFST